MKKILSLILICLALPACSIFRVHKLDVEQGNVISQENISKLHKGMSTEQVKEVIGNPVLINVFTPDRLNYVYTEQKGYEKMTETRIILIFQNNHLQDILR